MQNKTKATVTLAASAICAAGTLPGFSPLANFISAQAGSIISGLFNHGFVAATIGGLADWFAVTALFHKPLGIKYRTEILKRNRGRITDAIVEFVEKDLLNTENIMEKIRQENAAEILSDYFEHRQGREKVKNLVVETLRELLADADAEQIAKSMLPALEGEIKKFDAGQIVDVGLNVATDEKHSRKIITAFLETGKKILRSEQMQAILSEKITELRQAYEGDSMSRAMLLSAIDLTDEKILAILNENAERKIDEMIDLLNVVGVVDNEKATSAKKLTDTVNDFIKTSAGEIDRKKLQQTFFNLLTEYFDAAGYIQNWIEVNVQGKPGREFLDKISRQKAANPQHSRVIKVERNDPIWRVPVEKLIDEKIDNFNKNPELREKFDRYAKNLIENILTEYHDYIPSLIRERMDAFSDEELTTFVEGKVSDDLQMIRINGAVCGAAAGMFLYLVSQLIEHIAG